MAKKIKSVAARARTVSGENARFSNAAAQVRTDLLQHGLLTRQQALAMTLGEMKKILPVHAVCSRMLSLTYMRPTSVG